MSARTKGQKKSQQIAQSAIVTASTGSESAPKKNSKSKQERGTTAHVLEVPRLRLALTPAASLVSALIVSIVAAGLCGSFLFSAHALNGVFGFPLDDAWIHLTFARTLAMTGRFAYYPGGPATAGSTSPLFTFLESAFWLFSHNEYIIAYTLGIFFFAGTVFFSHRLLKQFYPEEQWIAVLGSLAVALEPRLISIAISGMETTLVTFLLVLTAYAYQRKMRLMVGVGAALLLWSRPDTLLFVAALAVQALLEYRSTTRTVTGDGRALSWFSKPVLLRTLIVFSVGAGLYAMFNLILSGSLLPNTFSAKLAYYKHGNASYLSGLWSFFAGKLLIAAFLLYAVHLAQVLRDLVRLQANKFLAADLFLLGIAAVYWWKLPYLYQNGRYVTPLLPFYLMGALLGALEVREWLSHRTRNGKALAALAMAMFTVILTGELTRFSENKSYYIDQSAYIGDLQVRTANWCKSNLPKGSVIATHDIGALGFYSGFPIVDVVGLITPEITSHIGDPKATIDLMKKYHVTHMAFLQNWFEVTNVRPVFQSDPRIGELMQVFPFQSSTAIATAEELAIHKYARAALGQEQFADAMPALQEGFTRDPNDAITHQLAGYAFAGMQRYPEAEAQFREALRNFPDDPVSISGLGKLLALQGRQDSAVTLLKEAVALDSVNTDALAFLVRLLNEKAPADAAPFAERLRVAEAANEAATPRIVKRRQE